MYRNIKRIIDIIFSIMVLPFFCFVIITIGPLIFFQDRGNIFYNAERLGYKGNVFKMYKLRSMKINAPDIRNEDGSTFNAEDDPRLTSIGKFIRKTSIDEIPQVLNVLKGEMSVVGPRPDLPEHYEAYSKNEKRKLSVKPGVTGYNQAYFRNTIPWKERLKNDLYYVDNQSFSLDLKIIVKTLIVIFMRKNIFISKAE
ncbi:sugar transferase [Salinicoccus roseus]|uniref:sugar transferase n=1 Tax=Salinicoccus roseus TaxID=45670 RepID=UPI001CA68C24|nr:sugar transferase [Salinicoccus roseus]MBY8908359.1 sugar transferase [Salinicoccus roseus]